MTVDEEEDYTEESYYEEEILEEEYVEEEKEVGEGVKALAPPTPPPPAPAASAPPARPPHPLFAAGGAKSALAAAAAEMEKKHKAAPIGERQNQNDEPPQQQNTAPPSLPVHPLFGGGGGGNKSALNDQIKLMAAKRNYRVAKEGIPEPPAPAAKKKSIDAVMPPNASKFGGNTQTASLADQVAMLAARRRERMEQQGGAEPRSAATGSKVNNVPVPPVPTNTTTLLPSTASNTPSKPSAPEKKKGVFGFGKKEPEAKKPMPAPTTPAAAPIQVKVKAPVQTVPPPEPAKPPAFTKAVLRKTEAPIANRNEPKSTTPSFANAKLRPTGLLDTTGTAPEEQETARPSTPVVKNAAQSSGPVQVGETITTRKITKKDPEYGTYASSTVLFQKN